MDTESFKVLEYGKITNWLASFASTICGKQLCRSVIPSGDYDEVVRLHHETAEAVQVQQAQSPPFGGIYDLRTLLKKASMGSVLEIDELRSVMSTMGGMRNIKYFFRDLTLCRIASLLKTSPNAISKCKANLVRKLRAAAFVPQPC